MFFSSLFSKNKPILGVDIGTSNIKIAQVTYKDKPILDTYGMVNIAYQLGGKNDESAIRQMAGILKTLVDKAGVSTKKCVISFPNSSVFTSVIKLPKMGDKDLDSAVEFEAKKYVPLALSEIDLSWTVVSEENGELQVLLTAVPKQVTENYMKVFHLAGLQPEVGEIEGLALSRSLIGSSSQSCVIIDIGARVTGLNVIENGFLRLSRNLNIGGDTITDKISQSLNISVFRAEQFKKDFGVNSSTFIPEVVKPVLNAIKSEVQQLLAIYQSHGMKAEKILLVGGGANLPGIVNFFDGLNTPVELGDPLKSVGYNQDIIQILQRYKLSLAVAIGLALRRS